MAVATYAERIALDLALLVASATVIDLSRQRDTTATEDTTRTTRVSQMASAKVEARLGPAGAYDDTDATIGNQMFLDLGLRLALLYYSQIYTSTLTTSGTTYLADIRAEIEEMRESLVQEATLPVVAKMDNDALNQRRDNSTWGSTADPSDPPEI